MMTVPPVALAWPQGQDFGISLGLLTLTLASATTFWFQHQIKAKC